MGVRIAGGKQHINIIENRRRVATIEQWKHSLSIEIADSFVGQVCGLYKKIALTFFLNFIFFCFGV